MKRINKSYRILTIIAVIILLVSIITSVYSIPLGAINIGMEMGEEVGKTILETKDEIIEKVEEGIVAEISTNISDTITAIFTVGIDGWLLGISEMFNPSLNFFYNMSIGNTNIPDSNYYSNNSPTVIELFRKYAVYAGATLATILFFFGMITYFGNGKTSETKNNPIQLVIMYGLALLGMYFNEKIMEFFLEIAQDVWEWTLNYGDEIGQLSTSMFIPALKYTGGVALFGVLMPGGAVLSSIFIVIAIIIACILLKGFLRLWFEMCERYIVVCLQIFFFPTVIPTIITKETKPIIASYMRMFVCQIFLLISGYVFMKGFTMFMSLGIQFTIIGFIFVLSYLKTAQRLDSYMASMGLNVAQTGANLLDSFRFAALSMGATLRGANSARQGFAGLMKASAISSGNRGLFKAASMLGFSANDALKAGGIKKVGSDIDFLKNVGMAGEKLAPNSKSKISVPENIAKEAVSNYIKNPSRENASAIRAIHNTDLAKAIQSSGVLPTGMRLDGSAIDAMKGYIRVQGTGKDGSFIKGTISNEKMSKNSIQTSSGNYFTPDNTLKKGSAIKINGRGDLESALMRTGTPNAGIHAPTMEDYNRAIKSGNMEAAAEMKKNGIVEAVYNGGPKTGTQLLTGKNSGYTDVNGNTVSYSEGLPFGNINADGDVQMYNRFSRDADIDFDMSQDKKNDLLFHSYFEDMEHPYSADELPSINEAYNNLSEDVRAGIEYEKFGHDYQLNYVNGDDGNMYLRCDYRDYDFKQDDINNLYPEWDVAPGAEPQRSKYGQQSIDVYNPDTGDVGTMYFSNVAVYGDNVNDNNRIITGRYGDDYVVSVQRKMVEAPDISGEGISSSGVTRIDENFKESPASRAGQELYKDDYAKECSQDAIDQLMREQNSKKRK